MPISSVHKTWNTREAVRGPQTRLLFQVAKETTIHMDDAGRSARFGSGRIWGLIMRLAGLFLAGVALLAILVVGLFFVLPVMLIGGIALHFYLRRCLRQARQRSWDGAIDAEYTVIEVR